MKFRKDLTEVPEYSMSGQELNEMAIDRNTAIDKCISYGKQFIIHFNKIYKEPHCMYVKHWCKEMQTWFDIMSDFVLKHNKRHLVGAERYDWFYSFGSSFEEFFNYNTDEIESYIQFIDELEKTKDVYESIHKIFNI